MGRAYEDPWISSPQGMVCRCCGQRDRRKRKLRIEVARAWPEAKDDTNKWRVVRTPKLWKVERLIQNVNTTPTRLTWSTVYKFPATRGVLSPFAKNADWDVWEMECAVRMMQRRVTEERERNELDRRKARVAAKRTRWKRRYDDFRLWLGQILDLPRSLWRTQSGW